MERDSWSTTTEVSIYTLLSMEILYVLVLYFIFALNQFNIITSKKASVLCPESVALSLNELPYAITFTEADSWLAL